MKRILLAAAILVVGFLIFQFLIRKDKADKNLSQMVSRHSTRFNQSTEEAMAAYYTLTDAFVNWDSAAVDQRARVFRARLDSLQLTDSKDSASVNANAKSLLHKARANTDAITTAATIEDKRHNLNELTDNLFGFLRVIQYDHSKLYLQQCPMAFNDTGAGRWLSKTDSIRNPYLGLHHPHYGKGMLECGETKEVLNFTGNKE